MPRQARKISKSGIYHIILRGVNRQSVFIDDQDAERFLDTIIKYKEISKYEIYAYCIMSNHLHLLMKEKEESVSDAIKRIVGSYVFWYNKKYERCGHLFQERFKSEAVENDEYFMTVLRYIHQNPLKAGIVKDAASYRWSSFNDYIGKPITVDVDFGLGVFSNDKKSAVELFMKFNKQSNNDSCLDYEDKARVSDTELLLYMKNLGVSGQGELLRLEKKKQQEIIKSLKSIEGVTVRQLSRLTGVSKSVINRI